MQGRALGAVVAGAVLQVLYWAFYAAFGVFLLAIGEDTKWSPTATTVAITVASVTFGVGSLVTGWLTDRKGTRRVVLACGVFNLLGYALASKAMTPTHLALALGVLGGIGMAGSYVPLTTLVARWSMGGSGIGVGVINSASAVGAAIGPPASLHIIGEIGWRSSYLLFAVILLLTVPVAAAFLHEPAPISNVTWADEQLRTESERQMPDSASDGVVVSTRGRRHIVALVAIIWFIHGLLGAGVVVYLYAYASSVGIDHAFASGIAGLLGLIGIAGGLVGGWSADVIEPVQALSISFALVLIASGLLAGGSGAWTIAAAATLFGVGWYAAGSLFPILVAFALGERGLGTRLGYLHVLWATGGGAGPMIVAALHARFTAYQPGWWTFTGLALGGSALSVAILRRLTDLPVTSGH